MKYRGNQLAALLSNWQTYEKMLSDYTNASGSAAAEAQKTADSIEGRLNKLSNTWNRTVANVVDSDILKTLTSIGTGAIDLVDDLGLLQTALAGLLLYGTLKGGASLLTWFKNAISSTMAFGNALKTVSLDLYVGDMQHLTDSLSGLSLKQAVAVLSTQNLTNEQMIAALTTANFSKEEAANAVATLSMSSAQGVATGTTWSLSSAFTALGAAIAANPIGAALTAITAIVSIGSLAINKYNQAKEEALQASKELTQTYKDEQTTLDEQITSYKELSKQLEAGNLSTEETTSIKQQLLDIQTSLISSYGNEASGIDLVNGKYKEQLDLLGELSKEKAKDYLAKNRTAFEDAQNELNKNRTYSIGFIGNNQGNTDLIDYLKKYNDENVKLTEKSYNGVSSYYLDIVGNVENADSALKQLYQDVEAYGQKTGENVSSVLTGISNQLNKTWTDDLQSYKDTYNEYIKAQIVANDTLRPLYQQSIQAVEDYNNAITSGEGISDAIVNLSTIQNKLRANTSLVEGSEEVFNELFSTLASGSNQSKESLNTVGNALSNILTSQQEAIDNYQKSLNTIKSALSSDDLSSSELMDLMQEFSDFDWQAYGITGVKGVGDLQGALKELARTQLDGLDSTIKSRDAIKAMYDETLQASSGIVKLTDDISTKEQASEDFYQSVLNGLSDTIKEQANQYNIDFQNYKSLQESKLALDKEYQDKKRILYGAEQNFRNAAQGGNAAAAQVAFGQYTQALDDFNGYSGFTTEFNTSLADTAKKYGKDTKKDKTELPEGYTNARADLEHRRNMGLADEAYYKELAGLETKYLAGHKEYKNEIWSIDEAIYKHKEDLTNKDTQKSFDDLKTSLDNGTIKEKEYYDSLEKLNNDSYKKKLISEEEYNANLLTIQNGRKELVSDNIKSQFDDLDHSYAMGEIDEATYQNNRLALAEKYYKGNEKYLDEWVQEEESYYQWSQEQLTKSLQNYADNQNKIVDLYSKSHDEIKDIASSYEDGSDEQVNALKNGIISATSEIKYLQKAIDDLNKKNLNGDFKGNEGIYNSQLEALQNALGEARSSIQDFQSAIADSTKASLDEVIKAFDNGYEKEKEYWEGQYNAYSDIVDAQKEILQLKREEEKYQKDIADKTKEIAKIDSRRADLQRAANTGDREAQAELRKLDEERAKKNENLTETQQDHADDLAQNALDKALDDNNKLKDAKLKALEEEHQKQIDDITDVYNQMITMITNAASYTDEQFGTKFQSYMAQLSGLGVVLSDSYVNDVLDAQARSTQANAVNSIIGTQSEANKSKNTSGLSGLNKGLASMGYSTLSKEKMVQLAQALELYDIDSVDDVGTDEIGKINKNKILEKLKRFLSGSTFATGGIGEVVHSLGETGIGLFRNKESLLTETQTELFKDFIKNIRPLNNLVKLSIPNVSNLVTNNNSSPTTINVTVPVTGSIDSKNATSLGNNIALQVAKAVIDIKRIK